MKRQKQTDTARRTDEIRAEARRLARAAFAAGSAEARALYLSAYGLLGNLAADLRGMNKHKTADKVRAEARRYLDAAYPTT